jgi:hypothetical protein
MRPARARTTFTATEAIRSSEALLAVRAPVVSANAAAPSPRLPTPPRASPIKDAIIRWLEEEL